jgi:hypothetical protein
VHDCRLNNVGGARLFNISKHWKKFSCNCKLNWTLKMKPKNYVVKDADILRTEWNNKHIFPRSEGVRLCWGGSKDMGGLKARCYNDVFVIGARTVQTASCHIRNKFNSISLNWTEEMVVGGGVNVERERKRLLSYRQVVQPLSVHCVVCHWINRQIWQNDTKCTCTKTLHITSYVDQVALTCLDYGESIGWLQMMSAIT